ncbi:hypothetical protein PR003_g1013 [Phytophthora rubi]|nr:hypothetical protein PR003_g1013 [Phytophthora rubi]
MEQLRRGSTNANFAMDFGAGAVLPATTPQCATYEDLLAAISGLTSFGDALFYDHVRRLTSRLKRFVLANMERDINTPERVTLTLMYVNNYLGRAMAHLVEDSPEWWRNYCEAVRAVDYPAADWQAALNGLALRLAARTSAPEASARQPQRNTNAPAPRRAPAGRVPIMPEHVRRQIPRDADGREPCLRYFSGGMCYGGSAERCAHAHRTHHWDRRLPRDVQDFIDRHYGPGPGPRAAARQEIRSDSRNDGSADSRRGRP